MNFDKQPSKVTDQHVAFEVVYALYLIWKKRRSLSKVNRYNEDTIATTYQLEE